MNWRLHASLAQISAEPDRRRLRRSLLPPLLLALSLFGPPGMTSAHEFRADERQRMIDEIVHIARSAGEVGRPALDDRVIAAMAKVPRHEFVPPEHRHAAYRNRPLPIGEGQTISQPYIVALMTDLLRLEGGEKVLEIGTGCGYQAAVLAEIAGNVHTIEIVEPPRRPGGPHVEAPEVPERAYPHRRRLRRLARGGAVRRHHRHRRARPHSARARRPAEARGRLVIPVGTLFQELMVVQKQADGSTINEQIVPVRFVPLTRDAD